MAKSKSISSHQNIEDLAFFGGSPTFSKPLHVGRPNIGNRERLLERINDALDRKWLSNDGPFVQELEQRFADYAGGKYCIAMCNGTISLEIAIRALDLQGEVIVPSFTFIATAHALQWQKITPVFCDIDPITHNIDPNSIEKLITPKTTGILGVHVWGRPCNIDLLEKIARKHDLKLAFDASHAVGCSHQGQTIGNFGEASIFSFHATKFFNTFEGGAVVTNNEQLAEKIRLMKNFGFGPGYDNVIYIGTNGKMNEISAAMGLTSLDSINDFIDINRQNYQQYRQKLSGIPGIKFTTYNENEKNNYQYIILEVDDRETKFTRDELVEILHAENVLARRYFFPGCHQMEPYRSYFPNTNLLLPETEKLTRKVLSLPTGTAVDINKINEICRIIQLVVKQGKKLRERLDRENSQKH
ncbi:aminotransferase class I/II-fold pyridoxal phosphate-dependent enzyme [Lusitaniella coriacea LEGE 07157]|uniref:Aminotransferase class I/II-fold pyridoxal phosphate-dependent enzyme n=1 Tax=Lusitaniella coriacea LEGE 07157 TaxID=945747 RepID=A0A8J7DVB9_9CYAN|nr:aminotransferase class I/II-fold pyridoxal phosphate-dependent enzyme [Lusitaniella coriacea]MBE9115673.1 aminotransferase class I/II-fold pyridoxal phosphate-dependent enzyme [Lusitaniella coriacea LEGE 07157]